MNNNQKSNFSTFQIEELEKMISLYFDGETSEEDEKILCRILSSCNVSSPTIDEAKAVMGFFSVGRAIKSHEKKINILKRNVRNIAAAILLLIITSAGLFLITNVNNSDVCIAYVNGEKINDKQAVMTLMNNEINEIAVASTSVDDNVNSQLNDIALYLNENQN